MAKPVQGLGAFPTCSPTGPPPPIRGGGGRGAPGFQTALNPLHRVGSAWQEYSLLGESQEKEGGKGQVGKGRDRGHITPHQETDEQSVYQITTLTCGGCVHLGGKVCRADQDSALFSLGTRAGRVLPQRAHGGFRAAQSLRGQGRASSRQVGLSQQGCVFPGAGTWARRGKTKLPSGKLATEAPPQPTRPPPQPTWPPPHRRPPHPPQVPTGWGPLTITGLWLQLFLSTQGLLIWFLLLRQLALCNQPWGDAGSAWRRLRGGEGGVAEAPYLSRRDLQGSHHPPSRLLAGMAPPGLGVEGRAGLGRLCLSSAPQLTGWCRSPLCPQLLSITFTWLMGREASLDVLSGTFSLSFSDVYLWRRNH